MQFLYLCPICLLIAAVFIFVEKLERYLVADVIKGVASAFFVLLGILGAFKSNDAGFARMVVIGLVIGAIADVLLNLRYVYEGSKAQIAFLAGILVFLLGHIAYIVACVPHCKMLPAAIVFGIILTAFLLYWIFGRIEAKPAFKVFGVFYIGAIVILNCVALVVLLGSWNAHWLMLFWRHDALLGERRDPHPQHLWTEVGLCHAHCKSDALLRGTTYDCPQPAAAALGARGPEAHKTAILYRVYPVHAAAKRTWLNLVVLEY